MPIATAPSVIFSVSIQPSDRDFGISFMAAVEDRDPHVRRLPPEESSDHLPDD
jgi:hypothetical protein